MMPFMDEKAIRTWKLQSKKTKNNGQRISAQPANIITGKLKQYQLVGLEWLVDRHNNFVPGILADEMVINPFLFFFTVFSSVR